MEGWIKLHRKLINWEWYQDSNMVHLFIHLLLSANHKPGKWRGISIERGQLITGRNKLSEQTGISQQSIRTCLDKLKATSELTSKPTNKYTIITICNYDDYQIKDTDINQQINQQLTNNQPATNQQLTTNKNNNNKKKEKEKVFEVFWDHYHTVTAMRKTDKEDALKYWVKLTDDEITSAHENVKPYFDSLSDQKYCKKARTYLGDKNFNDEFTSVKKADPKYNFDYSSMINPDWDGK